MTTIRWDEVERDAFAAEWPGCTVPANGWAEFDAFGNLVDLSINAQGQLPGVGGGGLAEFLDDLKERCL